MMELADIHCHLLPYVDDGAATMDEALDLLRMEAEQGVTTVCLTPHLRRGMFVSTDEKIREMFLRLQQEAREQEIPIQLQLSREYYYDSRFLERLDAGEVIPMGSQKVLLVEFSYDSAPDTLLEASERVFSAGYYPLFAHIERYHAIQDDPGLAKELMKKGTLLQLNADDILGEEGWKMKRLCKKLLAEHCVHIIASDAHSTEFRTPKLDRCAHYLEKKIGREDTRLLMLENPLAILK